jgi:hypothetical protein
LRPLQIRDRAAAEARRVLHLKIQELGEAPVALYERS